MALPASAARKIASKAKKARVTANAARPLRAQAGVAPNIANAMDVDERASESSDFGVLLRRHRLAAGLSQEALAERARMSSDGISALERGHRRTPQRETLALLCAALALNDAQAREFEAAATRSGVPVRMGTGSSPRVPRRDATASNPLLAHVQLGPFQASLSRPAVRSCLASFSFWR